MDSQHRRLWSLVWAAAALVCLLGLRPAPGVAGALLLYCVGGALVTAIAARWSLDPRWVLLAAALPLLVAFGDLVIPFLPRAGDVSQYDRLAWTTAQHLRAGTLPTFDPSSNPIQVRTYALLLGAFYAVFGHHPIVGVGLNSSLWGLTAIVVLRMAQLSTDRSVERYLGPMLLLYPAPIRFMSRTLRESTALFVAAATAWALFMWLRSDDRRWIAVAFVPAFPLALLRIEIIPPLYLAAFAGWIYKHRAVLDRRKRIAGVLCAIGLSLVTVWLEENLRTQFLPLHHSQLEDVRENLSKGPNAYLVNLEYGSWFDVILYYPVRLFYLLFSPFPWELSSYALLLAVTDAIFMLPVVGLAIIGLGRWRTFISPETLFLCTYALVVLSAYSLVVSNEGAASRRRLYAIPIVMIIASYGVGCVAERFGRRE